MKHHNTSASTNPNVKDYNNDEIASNRTYLDCEANPSQLKPAVKLTQPHANQHETPGKTEH